MQEHKITSHSLASSCISSSTSSMKKDSSYVEGAFPAGGCACECATAVHLGEGSFQASDCADECPAAVLPVICWFSATIELVRHTP